MTRSVWKGPFVDGYLLKKAEKARATTRNEVIKIWSRRSTMLPLFWLPKIWSATSSVNLLRPVHSTAMPQIRKLREVNYGKI